MSSPESDGAADQETADGVVDQESAEGTPEQEPAGAEGQSSEAAADQDAGEAAERRGGTRWGRFALALGGGLGVAGVVVAMTMEGVLAASFAVAGNSFEVTASRLTGTGFTQYGDIASPVEEPDQPVAVATFNSAQLSDMCLSSRLDLPVGEATLVMTAGEDTPVDAGSMTIDIAQMSGDTTFDNIEIGRDASTLDRADGGQGPVGGFGLQADTITITDMQTTSWAISQGTLSLSNLDLRVVPGDQGCF